MKKFIFIALLFIYISAITLLGQEDKQPNIVFIISDYQSNQSIGAFGNSIQTSNIDNLGSIRSGQLDTYHNPEGHVTDITGQEAVQFIRKHNSNSPLILYVAFNAPHVPRETYEKFYDLYPEDSIKLPPSVKAGPLKPNIQYNYAPDPLQPDIMKSGRKRNKAMVTDMVHQVGDIIKSLKAAGKYKETIIVFMSDQGISFGKNGVAGKVCLYEPSVIAPLIISGPGLPENRMISERVYLQDVYPTLLDMLGIRDPDNIGFKSLIPLIEGKDELWSSIYFAMLDTQRGIINNDKKLILYPKSSEIELYNLSKDGWEMNNFIEREGKRMDISQLLHKLMIWQKRVDRLDIIDDFVYLDV